MTASPLPRIEGKYEILGKLREGGMGAIYKVRHRLLDEIRIIKMMRPQLVEDAELRARFLREARLAIQLRHPNIAQLYDFTVDEEDGTAFIVMEFIAGKTFEDILTSGGPPPLGLALELAQQSLRAIGYLHSKGFLHRDISPDNLMVTEDSDGEPLVKLIDLGIAKILDGVGDGLTQTGTFLGKVRYASPEQFSTEGASSVDARGDLYSFGVVFYELLTGRFPILGRDPSSLIAGHLFRPPLDFAESDPSGRLPEGLRAVLLKALAKTAGERFATAKDFSQALAPFRAPGDISDLDLPVVLRQPGDRPVAAPFIPPGSTQERLDERFGLEATPSPSQLEVVKTEIKTLRTPTDMPPTDMPPTDVPPAEPPAALPQATGTIGLKLDQAERDRLQDLRDQAEAARRAEEERQAVFAAAGAIEAALEQGDLAAAAARLDESHAAHGSQVVFAPLRQRLTQLRRAEEEQRQADEKRRQGEERLRAEEKQRLEEERQRLAEQERLRIEQLRRHAEEQQRQAEEKRRQEEERRKKEEERLRAEEKRRQEEEKQRLAEEERLRIEQERRHAEEKQRQADEKRRQEEERRKKEEERQRAEEKRRQEDERQRLVEQERLRIEQLRRHAEEQQRQADEKRRQEEKRRKKEDEERQRAEEKKRQEQEKQRQADEKRQQIEQERQRAEEKKRQQADRSAPAPAPASRRLVLVAAAALGLLLVAALVWWIARSPAPAPAPGTAGTPPPGNTPPAAVATGTLILDAVPWGEVVEVVDAQGKPQPLGAQRFTPLVLALPAGRYTVTLRNPNTPQPVRVTAEVLAGVSVRSVAEIGQTHEEELFRGLGW